MSRVDAFFFFLGFDVFSFVNTENSFYQFRTGPCSWENNTKRQKFIEHVLSDHLLPFKRGLVCVWSAVPRWVSFSRTEELIRLRVALWEGSGFSSAQAQVLAAWWSTDDSPQPKNSKLESPDDLSWVDLWLFLTSFHNIPHEWLMETRRGPKRQ